MAKFKVGDRVGIRNYNGTTWYAKIVSIKSPSEYRVDGIGKSSGLHMDVDEVEIKYVLKKDADGDLVYTPVNSVSNGVGVFDGAYVVERTSRDGKFKVYLVNPPNKKPLAEFATREEAERFVADKEKNQSSALRTTNAVVANAARSRNAAGYVDAASVVLYPGDAVVFKSDYRLHKDDDEWLDRNGDTVREVRGQEVKLGPSANDWAKKSELMVWHNASRSRNAVVQKALNAVARNVRAIPVDSKGKGIVERCKIRTTDGEVGEVAHIDEDGFVYFEAKDGRIRGVPADTVVRLNADTSVIRETAVNGVWETESKLEREIARTVGADIDVGIYGSAIAIGGVPDEDSAGKVKEIVARMLGPVASWQVKKDIIGYTIHAKVAKPVPTNSSRTTNAVVAKALNASHKRRS